MTATDGEGLLISLARVSRGMYFRVAIEAILESVMSGGLDSVIGTIL